MSKLTLNISDEMIAKAKVYASENNRSLSAIVESIFQVLTSKNKSELQDIEITPFVQSMIQEQSLPVDINENEYFEYLLKKHQ